MTTIGFTKRGGIFRAARPLRIIIFFPFGGGVPPYAYGSLGYCRRAASRVDWSRVSTGE